MYFIHYLYIDFSPTSPESFRVCLHLLLIRDNGEHKTTPYTGECQSCTATAAVAAGSSVLPPKSLGNWNRHDRSTTHIF